MDRRKFLKGAAALAALAMLPIELNAQNPPVLKHSGFDFGDGRDGTFYLYEGNVVELSRDMYFNILDFTQGGQLITNGYRVYCREYLIFPDPPLGYPHVLMSRKENCHKGPGGHFDRVT